MQEGVLHLFCYLFYHSGGRKGWMAGAHWMMCSICGIRHPGSSPWLGSFFSLMIYIWIGSYRKSLHIPLFPVGEAGMPLACCGFFQGREEQGRQQVGADASDSADSPSSQRLLWSHPTDNYQTQQTVVSSRCELFVTKHEQTGGRISGLVHAVRSNGPQYK